MMLKPLRSKTTDRNRVSKPKSMMAPTKGWYVGENIADAPEGTAFALQNAFPQLDYVRVRRGSQAWATGMGAQPVSTLVPYSNAGASRLFAACNGQIFDVSNTGAVGAAAVTGLSNSTLEAVQFQGLGGSYLIGVNGADIPQIFDGSAWNRSYSITATTTNGSTSVTAVSSTAGLVAGQTVSGAGIASGTLIASVGVGTLTLSTAATQSGTSVPLTIYQAPPIVAASGTPIYANISVFKNRLYLVEKNSLNVWYLGVNAIGGAATLFPMQGVFRLGGTLIATASWAVDSNSGIYETFVAITSEGEVAMYNGSDPSSWSLSGLYRVSRPLGTRCLLKAGGDLAIMTEDGIVPMSKVQSLDQVALQNVAISKPIAPAWRQAVLDRTGLTGWQIVIWPRESMGIVNLPKANTGDKTQFIVNARTGAWASYLGWDANCFAVFGNALYFGTSDGRVMQAEVGAADDGGNYTVTVFPSFNALSSEAIRKDVRMVRPFFASNVAFQPQITIKVDFDTTAPIAPTAILPSTSGAKWDSAKWDADVWPADLKVSREWQTATGYGVMLSPVMQITLSSATVSPDIRFMQTDVLFEDGNILG